MPKGLNGRMHKGATLMRVFRVFLRVQKDTAATRSGITPNSKEVCFMPEQNEKLQRFTEAVMREAARESNALRRELYEARTVALEEAHLEAREASRAYYDREAARIRAEAGREVSRHLMDVKRQVYLRRKEISEEVIEKVRGRIAAFTASPDYPAHLEKLLCAAMKQLPGATAISLRLREEDLQYGPQLASAIAPVSVECVKGSFALGGLAIRCPELGLRLDCSFDTRLEELSGHFAEQFGLSLSDELDFEEVPSHE